MFYAKPLGAFRGREGRRRSPDADQKKKTKKLVSY